VEKNQSTVCVQGGATLHASAIEVPADISSAAFFLVGAAIAPGSDLTLEHVGINPTRTGVIEILRQMGADLEIGNQRMAGGEPMADIRVRGNRLRGIEVPPELVPLAIDEFPAVFIAAANAEGTTVVTGAQELRVKESDRIQAMADGLQTLGVRAEPTSDGMRVTGGPYPGGQVSGQGDHRVAMAFAVAGLRATTVVTVTGCANVATSFPGFVDLARSAGLMITAT
jgi:3-phosphoshikimate 1-carboxyvinyltransferase